MVVMVAVALVSTTENKGETVESRQQWNWKHKLQTFQLKYKGKIVLLFFSIVHTFKQTFAQLLLY